MCNFFSFISMGNGDFKYFTAKDRQDPDLINKYESFDSHASIAHYFDLNEDRSNKYEYSKGEFRIDQLYNIHDDSLAAKTWVEKFVKSDEFKELCLEAVKQDDSALYYVKKQTKEICLAAVKQNGFVLDYVKNQTPELCLEAVKQDGCALYFVKKQTPEICLAAVKQNGLALDYVKKQTPEICLEAVKNYGRALEFVKKQTPEICLAAVKQTNHVLTYVKNTELREQIRQELGLTWFI